MNKFEQLGLSQEILKVIKEMEFTEPSEIQEKTIPLALAGHDIVGGSATGSGKTLAFAAPIIEKLIPNRRVQALILTPTRELADQVASVIRNFAKNKDLHVLALYGGVDFEAQARKMSRTDIIVGTPGRTLDHLEQRTLNLEDVKFLVLDEVDRMLDMGFIRDVEKILKKCPVKRQTLLFSATISKEIDHIIKKYTNNPKEISVSNQVDHSKLSQFYYDVPSNMKFSLLVHLLKNEKAKLVMVFSGTRKNADMITANLNKIGIEAQAIHGGLSQNKRINVISEFHGKGVGVLICTDVAARGLDIKGVTHVYNFDLPFVANDYVHRIGRTARAGADGKAISLLAPQDYHNFKDIIKYCKVNPVQLEVPKIEQIAIDIHAGKKIVYGRDNGYAPRGRSNPRRGPRREGRVHGFGRRSEASSQNQGFESSRGSLDKSRYSSHRGFSTRSESSERPASSSRYEGSREATSSSRGFGSRSRFGNNSRSSGPKRSFRDRVENAGGESYARSESPIRREGRSFGGERRSFGSRGGSFGAKRSFGGRSRFGGSSRSNDSERSAGGEGRTFSGLKRSFGRSEGRRPAFKKRF